jgi:hypothetical protein
VRWYGAPLFDRTFTVVKRADRVEIGSSLVLPLVSDSAEGWFAASRDTKFTVRDGRWTLASVRGDGVGTIK